MKHTVVVFVFMLCMSLQSLIAGSGGETPRRSGQFITLRPSPNRFVDPLFLSPQQQKDLEAAKIRRAQNEQELRLQDQLRIQEQLRLQAQCNQTISPKISEEPTEDETQAGRVHNLRMAQIAAYNRQELEKQDIIKYSDDVQALSNEIKRLNNQAAILRTGRTVDDRFGYLEVQIKLEITQLKMLQATQMSKDLLQQAKVRLSMRVQEMKELAKLHPEFLIRLATAETYLKNNIQAIKPPQKHVVIVEKPTKVTFIEPREEGQHQR